MAHLEPEIQLIIFLFLNNTHIDEDIKLRIHYSCDEDEKSFIRENRDKWKEEKHDCHEHTRVEDYLVKGKQLLPYFW